MRIGEGFHFGLLHALRRNRAAEDRAMERLASGLRINRGSDDPAGMISASRLDAAVRALEAESRVLSRLDSNATIADGHLGQLGEMAAELQSLLVRGANSAALSLDEQAATQMQIDSLLSSLQRFGGDALQSLESVGLSGDEAKAAATRLSDALAQAASLASGGENSLSSGNFEAAQAALSAASLAFSEVRGRVGAFQKYEVQSRMESLGAQHVSLSESLSRVRDADYAEEFSNLSRAQVLTEANLRMLRFAQRRTDAVLALLR